VLDRFWSRQLTNNNYCLIVCLTFCFIYVWMITSSLGFMYTWSWLDMCLIFQLFFCLFDCWLWVTEMGWPGVGTVSSHVVKALQSLPVWEQCFQTQFGVDFWQWKCYVRTVDSRITVFTMYVFVVFLMWCFICILLFCVKLWGRWRKWQLRPSLPVPVFLIKYFVLGRDAEINCTELN